MDTVIKAIGKRVWWQQVLLIMLMILVVIQLAGMIGTKVLVPIIGWSDGILPAGVSADSIEGRFARWDSGFYLQIAQHGYESHGTERAFFPLYPLLINFLSKIAGLSLLWSGLIIAVVCFVGASMLLYQWVQIDHGSKIAFWSVVWLCVFPMSFFFSSLYAESLLLLTSIAAMYFARRGHFIASGVAISLAGATRPTAFLLAIPYVIEFLQQKNFMRSQWIKAGIGAVIAPLGVVAYFFYLAAMNDSTDALNVYQKNLSAEWGSSITWPWLTLYDGLKAAILSEGINADWFSRLLAWHDLGYALLGMMLAISALSRIRPSASLYLLSGMLFFFTNHGPYGYAFWSTSRRVATLFPIYLILVLLTDNLPVRYRQLILVLSIGMLIVLSVWFATGRWVA